MPLELWEDEEEKRILRPQDQRELDHGERPYDPDIDIGSRLDYCGKLKRISDNAFRRPDDQQRRQTWRVAEILELAEKVPVYRDAFAKAGVKARHFTGPEDIRRFPLMTKRRLVDVGREGRIHPKYLNKWTYETWSSGSSGLTLPIEFDPKAVIEDTRQGVRQLSLQSAGRFTRDDMALYYYTCPWYTDNIAGEWQSAFISTLVPAQRAALRLYSQQPRALLGYPSVLQNLAREISLERLGNNLALVVTNSEQSTQKQRNALAQTFDCAVLDEYSMEEMGLVAYQLPDKKFYYVCEDNAFLEILDPETREPVPDGEWGEAVITSLLNEAMPFIRYATGDLVKRPKQPYDTWFTIGWSPLEAIGGRKLDSFIRPDGGKVPSGVMLDVIYGAFHHTNTADRVERFELIQLSRNEVRLNLQYPASGENKTVRGFVDRVRKNLKFVLDHPSLELSVGELEAPKPGQQKQRSIRSPYAETLYRKPSGRPRYAVP